MVIPDEVQGLGVLLVCLVTVVLALRGLWHRPRCRRCRAPAVIDDATGGGSSLPIVMLIYRCPRCRQVVHQRFVGGWD